MPSAHPNHDEFHENHVIRLPETVVNQIAAGEVIERPASVVKELIENAIDAGANRIEITTLRGGKSLIRVSDNGYGMNRDDLALAIERHCTSKLADDLMDIRTLGFRGEALPSVGSVSHLTITSRHRDEETAWKVQVSGGKTKDPVPAALGNGSVVEVSDLFFATPARLKFLKSDQAETNAITDMFKRMAIAFPGIRFSIDGDDRSSLDYPPASMLERLGQVMGKSFCENAFEVDASREGVRLSGYASLPTFNRGNGQRQYFFVNGRPVRDKALLGAVRGAYADFLARDRHAVLALFIDLDPHLVDVNVHPAKADVRFRDAGLVRGLLVGALKEALAGAGHLSSREGSSSMMGAFRPGVGNSHTQSNPSAASGWARPLENRRYTRTGFAETQAQFDAASAPSGQVEATINQAQSVDPQHRLGAARAQLHENYIVAQTEKGLVIVDQHAAHERIVYEALKAGMENGLASQLLLIPEIVDLPEEDVTRLASFSGDFHKLGLEIEAFGPGAIAVRATPAMLGETDTQKLLHDLADEISEWGSADGLKERLEYVAATMACHGSVRSGRVLKAEEMNALLRQMEATPNSGQCNHGRPTYIELDLKDIERLFGR